MSSPKYVIARYEDNGNSKIVAFYVIIENGSKTYFESVIPMDQCHGKTDNEICCLAYEKMKHRIDELIQQIKTEAPTVIGAEFIPPDVEYEHEFII